MIDSGNKIMARIFTPIRCPECQKIMWYSDLDTIKCLNQQCKLYEQNFTIEKNQVELIPKEPQKEPVPSSGN
jgi:hypothetical protein